MIAFNNILLAASLLTCHVMAGPLAVKRDVKTFYETEYLTITVTETVTIGAGAALVTPPPDPATSGAAAFHEQSSVVSSDAPPAPPAPPAPTDTVEPPPAVPETVSVQPKDTPGSSSASCEGTGNLCAGDVTHWDGGLGACGWNVNTDSEYAIALPHGFMGTQSNGNPYCGRTVTLVNPVSGTTVTATVGDKCMGCEGRAIDCTNALFNAITDGKGDGRMAGIQWYFS
ncbi:hypothetical protein B0A52_05602 [Exophiala mesophila]|uniref:RlpA-like protein double-psi beta-barrel domain-containing protein n=1 Tax=Exophiala mesophila TaxID=212818 RepID=A0A438N3L2_EXOME|nr:hypothetical protein B0A52_05602 [Exophiala mesophila]